MISKKKAEITYPTEWIYTIIGSDTALMKNAVSTVIQNETYSISESNKSSRGKYVSLNVKMIVFSEEERDKYFKSLAQLKEIKMVL